MDYMRYNIKDSRTGRFTKVQPKTCTIVPGRLYEYKDVIVRAGQKTSTGLRLVTFHKVLSGFVPDTDLKVVGKARVASYLKTQ